MKIERILNYVLLIGLIMVLMFVLVNGQDDAVVEETEVKEEVAPAPLMATLDVLFIDKINGSAIEMTNCAVVIKGKMKIAENSFDYEKTFWEGDRYEITIMIEPKK